MTDPNGGKTPDKLRHPDERLVALARHSANELAAALGSAGKVPDIRVPGYEITRPLRSGGQGHVFQAIHKTTGRDVAIKVLRSHGLPAGAGEARFRREIQILAQLRHPNIVSVHDSGEVGGCRYFVMDYVDGLPLDRYPGGPAVPVRETLELFAKICEAVAAAHQRGIIHRDLKPANIFVDSEGEPHILDFGLAKLDEVAFTSNVQPSGQTLEGQFLGSLAWSSPEQAEGASWEIDVRTDVYSLGVILHHMLTSEFPYSVKGSFRDVLGRIAEDDPVPPGHLREDLNDELDTIVFKCLAKEPDRRYQSSTELAADIRRYLKGEPIQAKADSTAYLLRKQIRRYRVPLAVVAAFVVLLLVSCALAWGLLLKSQAAEQLATRRLYEAYLSEARALHRTRQPGQRLEALEVIRQAAAIRPSLEVRNEAIAALGRFDLKPLRQVKVNATDYLGRFTADLEHLYVIGGSPRKLHVRRTADGAEVFQLDGRFTSVDFSPDGEHLLVGRRGINPPLQLWNLQEGEMVWGADILPNEMGSAAFNAAGTRIAVAAREGTMHLYSSDGKPLRMLPPVHRSVSGLAFHPRRPLIAVSYYDAQEVLVRDLHNGEVVRIFRGDRLFQDVAWSPDGTRLACGSHDNSIYIWDMPSGERVARLMGHTHDVVRVGFVPRGDILYSMSWDDTVRIWDLRSGSLLLEIPGARSPGISSTGRHFSYCHTRRDGVEAVISEVLRPTAVRTFIGERVGVSLGAQVAFHPRYSLLASGGQDVLRLWDLATGKEIDSLPLNQCRSVMFCPNDGDLITASDSGVFRWDVRLKNETVHVGPALRLVPGDDWWFGDLSRDGRLLAVPTRSSGSTQVFEIDGSDAVQRGVFPQPQAIRVSFSPDGRWLATGTRRAGNVRIWDRHSAKQVVELPGTGGAHVRFAPDGRRLFVGPWRARVQIWNVGTWELRRQLDLNIADRGSIPIALSKDGTLIAIKAGRAIALLRADSCRLLALLSLPGSSRPYRSLAFNEDGTQLCCATMRSNVIHIWDLRLIRRRLVEMGLDWDLPPYPPATESTSTPVHSLEVDYGEFEDLLNG